MTTPPDPASDLACGVFYCLLFFIAIFYTTGAHSRSIDTTAPLHSQDMNPLVLIHALPVAGSTTITDISDIRTSVHLNISNTSNSESPDNDFLLIDGETYKLDIVIDYGLAKDWAIQLTLPFISHQNGMFDANITGFHNFLGFPNGNRAVRPTDELLFFYRDASGTRLSLDQPASGIGNISIDFKHQLPQYTNLTAALSLGFTLPSGSVSDLTGSESIALRSWYSASLKLDNSLSVYGHAGVQLMDDGDLLADKQVNHVEFGSIGVRWHAYSWLTLLMQTDLHTALYKNTKLTFLDSTVYSSFGVRFNPDPQLQLDFMFSEDVKVGASPDIVFVSGLRYLH